MKRNILILVLLFASAFPAFAQIENEIEQSKKEKIAKGRTYLLEKFLDRDYDKVKEIKDYLLELEDENYAVLVPAEYWHILFWTKEYDALTADFRGFDSTRIEAFKNKVKPERDQLGEQLTRKCIEDEHLIRFNLQEAQLPAEDNDFLSLFLDWDLKPFNEENQDQWNEKADQFLAKYPNSAYEWFVRHAIRVKIEEDDWVWGWGFGLGSGKFTKDLNTWMSPTLGGFMCIEANYKRCRFSFVMDGVDIKLRENPSEKGDGSILAFNLTAGYDLIGWRRIDLTPFVGIGVGFISSKSLKNIPELKELTEMRVNCELGADLDIRFSEYTKKKGVLPYYIRLRYWYDSPSFGKIGPNLNGGCHCFMVGVGASLAREKRVY